MVVVVDEIDALIAHFTEGAGESLAKRVNEKPLSTHTHVPRRQQPEPDLRDALIAGYAALQRDRKRKKHWWRTN